MIDTDTVDTDMTSVVSISINSVGNLMSFKPIYNMFRLLRHMQVSQFICA